ncbi:unnamed protein product [Moneuplotes crassus]|uniref:Uncharacterized protein n=1 Tax=Euplotes crassus TaxID=5936 RepID=A0AAD1U4M7_EUPCR|nr:unnamed protein product [Moneuplotes crassus]
MKNNQVIPRRLQCSDLACKNHRFYFCRDHQVYSCKGCSSKMHYKCQLVIIQDLTDLRTDVKEVQRHVTRFQELATENGLEVYLSNIDSVIKDYQGDLAEIERKINEAIAHDHYEKYDTLRSQIREYASNYLQIYTLLLREVLSAHICYRIQNQMADEQVVKDILFLSTTRDASRYVFPRVSDEFSSAIKVEQIIDSVIKQNVKFMEEKLTKEASEVEQQCKDRLSEEFKEQEQKQATEQVLRQAQDMLEQKQENLKEQLERELSKKVEEIKQAKYQNKKYQEEISKMSEGIQENESHIEESKETIIDRIKSICPDFNPKSKNLELHMSEDKSKNLVKSIGASKYSLGDMNRLQIDKISNEDHTLNNFLKNCSHSSFRLLSFNDRYLGSYGSEPVKIKFYEEGMQNLLANVTKEVYLKYLIVDASDLSQIVKACVNSERLTIGYSKILTSDSLDFSTPAQTKLQYLSFCYCGATNWGSQKWDKYPARFEKIIVAIKNSSLKNSLDTISIYACSISVSKVNELLAAHGLSHISVDECGNIPLTE